LSFVKKVAPKSIDAIPIAEVVDRTEILNQGIGTFRSKSDGWAPVAAAGLLGSLSEVICAQVQSFARALSATTDPEPSLTVKEDLDSILAEIVRTTRGKLN
jgi:hypothetical protein